MNRIKIFFPHTDYSEVMAKEIEAQLEQLTKKYTKFLRSIDVYVSTEHDKFMVKMVMKTTLNESVASHQDTLKKAIKNCVMKLKKELEKEKTQQNHIHR